MRRALGTVLALVAVLAAMPAAAHVVSDREVVLFRQLPPGLIALLTEADRPDSLGAVATNRAGWQNVMHQRGAMTRLIDGVSRADSVEAEEAWRAIDLAWVRQTPAGDYESPRRVAAGPPHADDLDGAVVWLGVLCRAEIAVMNSPLRQRFSWRVTLMLPKLRRSMDWVATQVPALERAHARSPEKLLADARLFLLADGIYHVPEWNAIGQRTLVAALALQQKDGAWVTPGPGALERQAACVQGLQAVTTYFSAPSLERALDRGARWLAKEAMRTAPRATRGKKAPDASRSLAARRDVLVALVLHGSRAHDAETIAATNRLLAGTGAATLTLVSP